MPRLVSVSSEVGDAQFVVRQDPGRQQRNNWLKGRFYEQRMLEYIWRNYSGGTFIDCGACIGNHTVFFAKFCADQVIAYEPVVENYRHLLDNVKINQLSNVWSCNYALGDRFDFVTMDKFGPGEGMNRVSTSGDDVMMTTLDGILADIEWNEPITLIKMDVEWMELQVLRGAMETVERHHPVIFAELNTPEEQDAFLTELPNGYRMGCQFNASPTFEFVWEGS